MPTSKLPQPGDLIPSAYLYQLELNVSVLTIGLADITTPVATGKSVSFGQNTNGVNTISYSTDAGVAVNVAIANEGALQDASAFTFTSEGNTYLLSNTALTTLVQVNLLGAQVSVLPASTLSTTQGQYGYPVGGTVVAPSDLLLSPASDSGVKGDNITNLIAPVITGLGEAGSTVILSDGAIPAGSAIVGSNGIWNITALLPAQGVHVLTAVDIDGSGNASASSPALTVTIDSISPVPPSGLTLSPVSDSGTKGDDITNVTNPAITGLGVAGSTLALFDGLTEVGTTVVTTEGTWSVTTSTLALGLHVITAAETDLAGNTSLLSLPLPLIVSNATPIAPVVYHWALPVTAPFAQSGRWLVNNLPTPAVPSGSDAAYFDTGSASGYSVSGNGTAGEVRIVDDTVSLAGTLSLSGLADTALGGITGLGIGAGGSLTVAAGGSISDAAALIIGVEGAGSLVVSGGSVSAATITLTANSTLSLNDSSVLTGTLEADGGSIMALPSAEGGGEVTLTNTINVISGTTNYFGSTGAAVLHLAGILSSPGTGSTIFRNGTVVLDNLPQGAQNPAILDGVTFILGGSNAQASLAYINSLANTTNVLTLGANAVNITSNGNDTINGGSRTATVEDPTGTLLVNGGTGAMTVTGGSGRLAFYGGSGTTTVSGGIASAVILGGASGGQLTGGSAGNNVLVSQGTSGAATLINGSGPGDRIFGSGTGNDVLNIGQGRNSVIGGGGNTTINAGNAASVIFTGAGSTIFNGGSGGQDTVVGGSGALSLTSQNGEAIFATSGTLSVTGSLSAADTIIGGSAALTVTGRGANMLVVAGSGNSDVSVGNGASLTFAGSGNLTLVGGSGSMQVVLGSGGASINEGAGPGVFDAVKGSAGGLDMISGFRPGTDAVNLFGYQKSEAQIQSIGSSSNIVLSDGTRIQLIGVSNPGNSINFA